MKVIELIRLFLPLAKVLVARTPSTLDDKVVEAIELLLSLLGTASSKADITAALRQTADEVEKRA